MIITERKLRGVYQISSTLLSKDNRGYLLGVFDTKLFELQGAHMGRWVQQYISYTGIKNVLRGLHVQLDPFTESKMITILEGKMYWVVVDLRKASPTFGQWDGVTLSSHSVQSIYVARGFGHGCLSMTDNCTLVINSDNFYASDHGCGIVWDDQDLGIQWPLCDPVPILSDQHKAYGSFRMFKETYGGI